MQNTEQKLWDTVDQMIADAKVSEETTASRILDAIMELPIELHELIELQALDVRPQEIKRFQN